MSIASQLSFSTATSVRGGALGSIPYQAATSSTIFVSIGAAGSLLTSNGTAPIWTPASSTTVGTSTQVQTVLRSTAATHFLAFVDSNNASATAEAIYTTSSFTINPATGFVGIGGGTVGSILSTEENTTGTTELRITNSNIGANVTKTSRLTFRLTDTAGTQKDVAYISAIPVNADSSVGDHLTFATRTADATPTEKLRITNNGGIAFGGASNYGSSGQILQSNGNAAPTWVTATGLAAGSASTASNIAGGTAGQVPYQTAAGVTSFYGPGTAGNVLVSNGTAAPSYNNTLTLAGTTAATSTTTGTLVVVGGVGIGDNLFVSNNINAVSGQFVSTRANNAATGAGQIYLNGASGNRIDFNQNGVAAPAFTTRSAGTKLVLYPNLSGSAVDYAIGIESSSLWSSVPNTSSFFRWYGGTTLAATLAGTGDLTLAGNLAVNGGNITTTQATFNLVNATAATVNFAGAATALNVGATTGSTNVRNNLSVAGNLTVQGTTTIVDSTVTNIADPIITLGGGAGNTAPVADDNKDRGIAFKWVNNGGTTSTGFFGYDDSTGHLTYIQTATITNEVVSGTKGAVDANLAGGTAMSLVYQSAVNTTAFLAAGSSGFILQTNGTGSAPAWVSAAGIGAGSATNADAIRTVARTTAAAHFLTFVDSNNATNAYESLYTTSSFVVNPQSGFVGIGTTVPSHRLTIEGSVAAAGIATLLNLRNTSDGGVGINFTNAVSVPLASINALVTSAGAGTDDAILQFSTAANGVNAERVRIDSAGNVGIGTSSPLYPLMVLRRAGSTITAPLLNLQSQTSGSIDGDSFILFGTQAANWSAGVDQADANKFRIEPALTLGAATGLTITTAGNVGIDTTDPRVKLTIDAGSVAGISELINLHNQSITSGHGTSLTFSGFQAPSVYPTWRFAGIKGLYDTTSSGLNTGGWGGQLRLFVNRGGAADQFEDVVTITGGGNVGIGTTTPATKLDVAGTLGFTVGAAAGIIRRTAVNGSNGIRIQGNASDTINTDAAAGAYITVGGGVIGDTFEGNIDIVAYGGNVDANRNQIRFSNRSGANAITERMRIDKDGNVGVGTQNPTAKFTISNTGSTTAAFYADIGNPSSAITLFEHTGASAPVPFRFRKSGFSGASPNYGLFYLHLNDGTVGNGSNLYFNLNNSAGTEIEYAGLGAIIRSNTAASEQGDLALYVVSGGVGRTERLRITSAGALAFSGASNFGSAGQVLQSNGNAAPTWVAPSGLSAGSATNADAIRTVARTNNASHFLTFVDSNNAANAYESLYTTSSFTINPGTGNVGIGTSLPASRLHTRQDQDGVTRAIVQNRNGSGTPLSEVAFITGGFDFSDNRYAYVQSGGGSASYLAFGTGNGAAPTERMRIDSVGNVGIGTSSPGAKLDVNGGAAITGVTELSLQRPAIPSFAGQGAPAIQWKFYSTGTTYTAGAMIQGLASAAWTGTSAPTSLRFYTVPSASTTLFERLCITAAGGIAFGGASNFGSAGQVLQSNGDAAPTWVSPSTLPSGTATNADAIRTIERNVSAAHFLTFVDSNNATNAYESLYTTSSFTINPATGNIGVGTAAPLAKFQVGVSSALSNYQGSPVGIMLPTGSGSWLELAENTTNGTSFRISKDAATGVVINTNVKDLAFRAGGYETTVAGAQLILKTTGNVFVGTNSELNPGFTNRLNVNGSIVAGSSASTNGSIILQGQYGTGSITNFGTEYSSGGPVLSYGVYPSNAATGAFFSSSGAALNRGAYTIAGNFHNWYVGGAQTVAIGNAATLALAMSVGSGGINLPTAASGNANISFDGTTFTLVSNSSSAGLVLSTNSTERLRITAAGGVAFGGASNFGSAGQVLQSNGNAAPTWINQSSITSGGTALTATHVGFGSGSNTLTGSANLTYASSILTISNQAAFNTTTPGFAQYGLHFQGQTTADFVNGITFNGGTGTTNAQAGIYVQGSGAYGTRMYFGTTDSYAAGSRTRMMIDAQGFVGINTTAPDATLTVNGAASFAAGTALLPAIARSGDLNTGIWFPAADTVAASTAGVERVRITATGLVGVGVTTPQYRLDVNSGAAGFQASFGSTISSGVISGIHFGYSEAANQSYRKSAIVFERQDSSARGKIHILNNGADSAASATIADAKMTIQFDGGVGIGTTSTTNRFEVAGTAGQLFSVSDSFTGTIFSANDVSGIPSIEVVDTGLVKLAQYNGQVAISTGTVAAGSALTVYGMISTLGPTGEIRASNEITAYFSSDRRLKENVKLIENPITIIDQIRGVTFDWTDEHMARRGGEDGYFVRKHDIGVIAQEVQAVLPELVGTRPDGYLAVKYEKLVPLLIEAIKAQQKTIDSLVNDLANVKEFISQLKNNK